MVILPQTITAQSINWCKVYFENCKDRNRNLLNLKIISYMKKINNFWSVNNGIQNTSFNESYQDV